jgi:hypothetical protein
MKKKSKFEFILVSIYSIERIHRPYPPFPFNCFVWLSSPSVYARLELPSVGLESEAKAFIRLFFMPVAPYHLLVLKTPPLVISFASCGTLNV